MCMYECMWCGEYDSVMQLCPAHTTDLLDDWLGSDPTDLLTFVPIDWRITVDLTRYEIFLFTNRYNWVDISMNGTENSESFVYTRG